MNGKIFPGADDHVKNVRERNHELCSRDEKMEGGGGDGSQKRKKRKLIRFVPRNLN